MVALAINGCTGYRVSDIELTRGGSSYTADTFRALHASGWKASQIFFILGADAFAEIATWYDFPAVLNAANFAVIARPGTTLQHAANRTPELRPRIRPGPPAEEAADTGVFLIEGRTRDISSTAIRAALASGRAIEELVPLSVARHIAGHHLYTTPHPQRAGVRGS
jgi:nicotinate-nucleotide adenylyltransferase